jgi:hypothetical protein
MTQRIGEKELLQRIAGLPREMAPGRDPWPEIAARIQAPGAAAQPTRRRWPMLAAAASLLLAIAAGWLVPRAIDNPAVGNGAAGVAAGDRQQAASGLQVALAASEAEYQAAFREFIPVGAARSSLSPQTVATIETNWAELRAAEQRVAAALERNPNDAFLNDRMFELRSRQLAFLQRLATLDMDNRRLTI